MHNRVYTVILLYLFKCSLVVTVSCIKPTMEGWYRVNIRLYIMSLWTLIVIVLMLPHYSECACAVPNCNSSYLCDGDICFGCNDGYYQLEISSCILCQLSLPGCATCSSSMSCTKCRDGYYLQSGSCELCPVRCSTCTSSTQCTTCKDTYWNVYNGCNLHCSDNCLDRHCEVSTGFCYSCITGKYGPQCGQDCNLCKDGQCDLRKCTNGCKDGYRQENTASGYSYCWKCVYDNCTTCSNETYCTQCEQGYYRHYYRQTSGRGTMNCIQCSDSCMDCSSTEHCHEDCIKHCSESVNPGTTKSTYGFTTIQSTASKFATSKTEPPTQTLKTIESIKSTESTLHKELYKELNSCQQQIKICSESNDQNQLTFGHGLATGIGITIVLFGSSVGIALFIRKQKRQHKHADENSEGHHEYVNTNMTDILSVTSEKNEVTNDIHTVSSNSINTEVINIDSSRDYVMLGERPTHESDYTDLQNT